MNLSKPLRNAHPMARSLAINVILGSVIGAVLALALLASDVASIGSLLLRSDTPFLFGALFVSGMAMVFATAMVSSALLMMAED